MAHNRGNGNADRAEPSAADLRRWRQHLANERAEAGVYRDLAQRRTGAERDILLALAAAEGRHEQHWLALLKGDVGKPRRSDIRSRILGFLARHFGSVFVLALAQRAEARSIYDADADATATMAADERIHGEVVRALATPGRNRPSGGFRAAVFGATTDWSATSHWCWASVPAECPTTRCTSPARPDCWPAPCRWVQANTSRCVRSASCWRPQRRIRRPGLPCLRWMSMPTNWPWRIGPVA